jgi:hypothetical protein
MRLRRAGAFSAVMVVTAMSGLAAGAARADEGRAESAPAAWQSHWYGGRLLLADGASVALMAAGGQTESLPLLGLGLAAWAVTSPILHAQHAGVPRAVGSLALRVGLPALGFLLAKSATDGCWRDPSASDTCDIGAETVGVLLGAIAAEILDVALLAHDEHAVAPPPPPAAAPDVGSVQLVLAPRDGGAFMGVAGRF